MAVSYGYDPGKRTYYGTTSDIELAKQAGHSGNFIDVSKYGDDSKYKDILHAYKTGANPVILGGAGATGGINDSLYSKLKSDGIKNLTRIGGKDRYEVQDNLKNYVSQIKRNKPFEFEYDSMNYNEAKKQTSEQIDPIYKRALENINAQKYQNELDAGQQANARGLSHSGLAADLQNKIAIAAQGQIANTEAERATKTAELAQALMQRDQARGDALRQQAFQEFMSGKQMDFDYDQFDYSKQRDSVEDKRYQTELDYQKLRDSVEDKRYQDQFGYQKYRDALQDQANKEALQWEKQKFKSETDWRAYVYENMSASERAQLDWNKQQFGEEMAWRIEESNRADKLSRDQMEYDAGFQTP
jgi:hypothetical protein